MKSFSADLLALLASNVPVYKVDLYKIGPTANGQMIYATNGGAPIIFEGNVYDPSKYGAWSRGSISTKVGLESNNTKLTVFADNQNPVYFPGFGENLLLLDGIKFGLLDPTVTGASQVTIYTAYMTQYGSLYGPNGGSLLEVKFVGEITSIDKLGLTRCEMTVSDMLYRLNVQTPQLVVQASCRWVLYSTGCTLNKANFSASSTVGAIVNAFTFRPATAINPITASGTWTQGYLTWTSGNNKGLTSFIRNWDGTNLRLDVNPIFPIQGGDGFTVYQGCSKSFAACTDFANTINFGGCPTVPVPESAI